MPIYNLFDHVEKRVEKEKGFLEDPHLNEFYSQVQLEREKKSLEAEVSSSLFAKISARLFFFMLLIADLFWGISSLFQLVLASALLLVTGGKIRKIKRFVQRKYLALKRAFCCFAALFMALFSPALGTMFACSYFLMFDKKGVDEIVPHVLQDQIKEFMQI